MTGKRYTHLPGSLRRQFAALDRRMRRVETSTAFCGAVAGLLFSFLLLFVSDRFWDTPPWMRALMLAAGLGMAITCVVWRLKRRVISPRREENFALTSQRHYRCLEDHLSGAVELGDEEEEPADRIPPHCRARIARPAVEPSKIDFRKAAATDRARQCAGAVLVLLAFAAAALLSMPEAGRSTFMRWLQPVSDVPRFTFVRIQGLPEELVVPHGEPFELKLGVGYQSFWQPEIVTASFPGGSLREASVNNGRATFQFPGQTRSRPLTVHSGDITLRTMMTPMVRPELTELAALIALPGYLQRPPMARPLQNGKLNVLEGSRIVLKGAVSRKLSKAWLNASRRLPVAGATFATEEIEVSADEDMTLTWEDWHGLRARSATKIEIVSEKDRAPQITISDLGTAVAIRGDQVLSITLSAGDDHGVKDIGIAFEIESAKSGKDAASFERSFSVIKGGPETDSLAVVYSFSPSDLEIPPGTLVRLRATARDFFPHREPSVSQEHQIQVLGEAEHAELVQKARSGWEQQD